MEKLRNIAKEAMYTPKSISNKHYTTFWRFLLPPILLPASYLFQTAITIRHFLYSSSFLPTHTLPLPVISIGNFTLGGNGKTPMAELISSFFLHCSIPPLLLSRGYYGADESRMLSHHLSHTSAVIGVGADRTSTAVSILRSHGEISVVILDDGMQHLSLHRDVEVLMVNALSPCGNSRFVPAGSLRDDPISAIRRSDLIVVHHADLAPAENLEEIRVMIGGGGRCMQVFYSRMAVSHFFRVGKEDERCRMDLDVVEGRGLICVSAIGCFDSFFMIVERLGGICTDRIDFVDHYRFGKKDMEMVRVRVAEMKSRIGSCVVVITEKDYFRDPEVFMLLKPLEVLVLCCRLEIIKSDGHGGDEEDFKKVLLGLFKSCSSP